MKDEVKVFLKKCADLIELIDELPEKAADFAESVANKATDMAIWAEDHDHVTPKMESAVDGMKKGAEKWIHGDDDEPGT